MEMFPGALTDVAGIEVGHAQDEAALTGCTVILARRGAVAGGCVRGLAPGTRETDLLRAGTLVEQAHAILLTGGSAFGLAAADGVMRYLEERGVGHDTGVARVPIVPGAVIFDLALGDPHARPDAAMGYAACEAASTRESRQGNVGAGMGASVGKLLGMACAMKGGLGVASLRAGELVVAALAVVNALGDVVAPATGAILAGARDPAGQGFLDTARALREGDLTSGKRPSAFTNTVIGVAATNARLDVARANELAAAAHDGLARAVRPAHTLYDGDTFFALATGEGLAEFIQVAALAAEATARAIVNAILAAAPAGGLLA